MMRKKIIYIFLYVLSGTTTGSETKNVNYFCDLHYKKICTNDVPSEESDQTLVTCSTCEPEVQGKKLKHYKLIGFVSNRHCYHNIRQKCAE